MVENSQIRLPDNRSYKNEMSNTLGAQKDIAPMLYELEAKYQPKYAALAADTYGQTYKTLQKQMQGAQNRAVQGDINTLNRFGKQYTSSFLSATPEVQRLLQGLTGAAERDLALGQSLSPEEERAAQQSARAAYAARGTGLGDQAVTAEILNRYNLAQARENQRRAFAAGTLGMAQQAYAPAMSALYANKVTPGQLMGLTGSVMGNAGPGLFNPESSYAGGIYNQRFQGQMAIDAANARNDLAANMANQQFWSDRMSDFANVASSGMKMACHVAREVYGVLDPRWMVFRRWLLEQAPTWFRLLYIQHGEAVAGFIRNKPTLKAIIRKLMDKVIAKVI